eukprot:612563-Hanusia_phi.AAC.1
MSPRTPYASARAGSCLAGSSESPDARPLLARSSASAPPPAPPPRLRTRVCPTPPLPSGPRRLLLPLAARRLTRRLAQQRPG